MTSVRAILMVPASWPMHSYHAGAVYFPAAGAAPGIDELFLEIGRTVVKRRSAKAAVRRTGESSFSLSSGPSLRDDDAADTLPPTQKSDCC